MLLINLASSLFNMVVVKALECMSVVNQRWMPRPKILDVNAIGEPVYYPYKVMINKCSGSCNEIDDPMAKSCVPDVTKNVNMKVYNLLMCANETKNAVWHKSCKCVCRLTSAVCNSKQIWNSDTCSCDCNEDFVDKMVCEKGCIWNPSICPCECDMRCKPGQYLDYKNCVCKNKLIGKVSSLCTSFINESMSDVNDDVIDDNNTSIYISLFFLLVFIGNIGFCVFAYFKWIKGKNLFEKRFGNKHFNDVSEIHGDY